MAYEPTPEMLDDLKTITGAPDTETDALTLVLKITGTKVLNDINQGYMPKALEPIVVEMAADAYRLNKQAQGAGNVGEVAGTVSSVSDGGQSISYRDSSYQQVLSSVATVFRDYSPQLARFRKTGW
ncbi:MAG: hypothetical protein ACOX3P_03905 [Saccharofermentanales bacterium]|jgi:hypothetical protein|nr:hypothetical protein [Bacillota bacterium]NLB08154.1 hypothetical protein [Clostridiales bacterium]